MTPVLIGKGEGTLDSLGYMDVSKNRGKKPKLDQIGWFIMENRKTLLKWMISGKMIFGNTHMDPSIKRLVAISSW